MNSLGRKRIKRGQTVTFQTNQTVTFQTKLLILLCLFLSPFSFINISLGCVWITDLLWEKEKEKVDDPMVLNGRILSLFHFHFYFPHQILDPNAPLMSLFLSFLCPCNFVWRTAENLTRRTFLQVTFCLFINCKNISRGTLAWVLGCVIQPNSTCYNGMLIQRAFLTWCKEFRFTFKIPECCLPVIFRTFIFQ